MMSSSKRPPVPGKEDIFSDHSVDNMSSKVHHAEDGNTSKNKASFNETIIAASYHQADGSDGHEHGVSQESSNSSGGFAHLKWNENFAYLMDDMDGIKLFRKFLEDNNQACLIDFRFACQGLKLKFQDNSKHTSSIVKSIYKKYIKGGYIQLKASTKKTLVEALKANNIYENIFEQAREDNDQLLESIYYPKFLHSDLYKKFAEYELENSKLSSHSGSSERNISHTYFKKLIEPLNDQSTLSSISFVSEDVPHSTTEDLKHTTKSPSAQPVSDPLPKPLNTTFSNPHLHTSLVSSDVLSLTSDQLTDDAISFTSSSHDGQEYKTKGSFIKHVQRMEHNNNNNNLNYDNTNNNSNNPFLPRTQRLNVSFIQASNMARNNPPLFAKILTNKLNEVLEAENDEQSFGRPEYEASKGTSRSAREHGVGSKVCKRQLSSLTSASRLLQMLNKEVEMGVDEEAHDVLDMQCSNIGKASTSDLNDAFNYYSRNGLNPTLNEQGHYHNHLMEQSVHSERIDLQDRANGGSMINVPTSRASSLYHTNRHQHPHSTSSLYNSYIDHPKGSPKRPSGSGKTPLTGFVNHTTHHATQHTHRPFTTKHKHSSEMTDLLNDLSNEKNRVQNWVESTKGVYNRLKISTDNSSDKASTFKKSSSNSHSDHSKRHSIRHKHRTHQDKKSETASISNAPPLQRISSLQPPATHNNLQHPTTHNNLQHPTTHNNFQHPTSICSIKKPSTVVGYYFWDEPIPYRTSIPCTNPTLGQFKNVLTRKGTFRYFFKHACSDFGGQVMNEEVFEDQQVLPLWEGKVFCKIEPVIHHCHV